MHILLMHGDVQSYDYETQLELWRKFGTFSRSILTMFCLAFGEWYEITMFLVDNVTVWFWVLSLSHQVILGFVFLGVLQSVFVSETFYAAEIDNEIMARRIVDAGKVHARNIDGFFRKADREYDGFIDRNEFAQAIQKGEMKAWLESLEIEVGDTREEMRRFWQMIVSDTTIPVLRQVKETMRKERGDLRTPAEAKGDCLTVERFTERVARISRSARTADVIQLQHSVAVVQACVWEAKQEAKQSIAGIHEHIKQLQSSIVKTQAGNLDQNELFSQLEKLMKV